MKSFIYDFETLGQNPLTDAVLSFACLEYDESNFIVGQGYDYDDLLKQCKFMKFDVQDQVVRLKRKIDPKTIEWWKKQPKEAQTVLKPSTEDKPVEDLFTLLTTQYKDLSFAKVFTRGNTFDPIFLKSILGVDPTPWWAIRDTRSYIDGLSYGSNLDNRFIPKRFESKFVHHDPRHDIVMDVMRMQELIRGLML